jgi:hypothetical protein
VRRPTGVTLAAVLLALVASSGGEAGGQAAAPARPPDPLAPLERFVGAWKGPGTLQGAPAVLELRFERVLGGRFLRIEHRNQVEARGRTMVFEGLALYRGADEGFAATWYDSFGHVYPVTATLDGDTLRALWGTPETEQGTTDYRLAAPGTLEVTDRVRRAGALQEFGKATLAKQ